MTERRGRPARGASIVAEMLRRADLLTERLEAMEWPSPKYRTDPVGFAREILKIPVLFDHQVQILEDIRDHDLVAVASGQKIGKTAIIVVAALWWYCSHDNARVVLNARTDRQVNSVLYRELRMIVRAYKRRTGKTLGVLGETAESGLVAPDLREIKGLTAREVEAVSGTSAGSIAGTVATASLLYLCDEASGLAADVFGAMLGNLSGGGKLVMTSNPTRASGPFFDAFQSADSLFRTHQISSEDVARRYGHLKIPGVVTESFCQKQEKMWGRDSWWFRVRILGQFVLNEAGKCISLDLILAGVDAWRTAEAKGRLHIGVDPAGSGDEGDRSAFAWRRGTKVLDVFTRRGMTPQDHLAKVLDLIATEWNEREPVPIVKVDVLGIGYEIHACMRAYIENYVQERKPFVLVSVRVSDNAGRMPEQFDTVRDELWGNGAQWLRAGGAIPERPALLKELHAPEWTARLDGKKAGTVKATSKKDMRKALEGASTDEADAVLLAVWPVPEVEESERQGDTAVAQAPPPDPYQVPDPYAGSGPRSMY